MFNFWSVHVRVCARACVRICEILLVIVLVGFYQQTTAVLSFCFLRNSLKPPSDE